MSCGNCGSFGEYRMLCDYNGYNNCKPKPGPKPKPSSPFSFACSPGIGCHKVNQAPNKAKNLYSDIQSCSQNCHASNFSYDCVRVGAYGNVRNMCVLKHGSEGKYSNLASCRKSCEMSN